jgi:serine/threonine-protein phosphatase 2A regulatory subunit B''
MAAVELAVLVPDDDHLIHCDDGAAAAGSAPTLMPRSVGQHSCSKRKLDELFYYWLSLDETRTLVTSLVDDIKAGRALPHVESHGSAPLSPVSKLLKGNKDLSEPWSPGRGSRNRAPTEGMGTPPRSPGSARSPKSGRVLNRDGLPPVSPKASKGGAVAGLPFIPQFYFPRKTTPMDAGEKARIRSVIDELFAAGGDQGGLDVEQLRPVTVQVACLPSFMNSKLFERIASTEPGSLEEVCAPLVSKESFLGFWALEIQGASLAARIFNTLKPADARHVVPKDWLLLLQELLEHHIGLEFLRETKEFQARYAETVIARIYYRLDRKHLGRLTLRDLEKSTLVEAMQLVDSDDDINKELLYFSYEHFYVIYCKFWELDTDHDLEINRDELLRYGNHALTRRLVDRIFSQEPWPFSCQTPGKMGYHDFVWFALSEEDKTNDISIEFWFRCIDIDNDGVITAFEMAHFYREQLYRMHCLHVEPISLADLMCQLNDMIKPNKEATFTLADFKKEQSRPMAAHFFNALGNLNKFVAHETRDPYSIRQERATPHLTDWDRFAQIEYNRLAAEEEEEEDLDDGDFTIPEFDRGDGLLGLDMNVS